MIITEENFQIPMTMVLFQRFYLLLKILTRSTQDNWTWEEKLIFDIKYKF